MDTSKLKQFAQQARRSLIKQTQAKCESVLAPESIARREAPKAVAELEKQIEDTSEEAVLDKVAYTWFNRFCALRFMDVNHYNRIAIVSPANDQSQPEILAEAKQGYLDNKIVDDSIQQTINNLLSGKAPSDNPQAEVYRLLLVSACNHYHKTMPFLFEKIADYTELLLPEDLLSTNSILAQTREAMTADICQDVEVIGWLYQFYISEKKDEVFASLKKNKKITPENIPAATQLFTPHWIVRYLVENSLGRLWILNHPNSKLIEQMDYYIKPSPQDQEIEFLQINSPEEIKVCDPACGSGHMLTYAFDLLYLIYEEQGYAAADIPAKILTHNLYGIEIDKRAGELAAFALTMKARSKYKRFLRKPIQPNICVLQTIHIEDHDIDEYINFVGTDLFTSNLRTTLKAFQEANNFGSLIRPTINNVSDIINLLEAKDVSGQLLLSTTHKKALQALKQADYLSQKYQVVIANPPYMGGNGMNSRLKKWAADNYKASKSDLFAMFMERNLALTVKQGLSAMITMQSWMFLSSFEKLRTKLLEQNTILSMAHFGTRAFDSIGGEVVSTTAFILENANHLEYKGDYLRLIEGKSEAEKQEAMLKAINNPDCNWLYHASTYNCKKIPDSPIAYWASSSTIEAFTNGSSIKTLISARIALATGNNHRFIRHWTEVSLNRIGFSMKSNDVSCKSGKKWFPCNKGGDFRKWYGNHENLVNWYNNGHEIRSFTDSKTGRVRSHNYNGDFAFKESLTWNALSTGKLGIRYSSYGFMFVTPGSSAFKKKVDTDLLIIQAFLSSIVAEHFLRLISPTLNIEVGNILRIPFITPIKNIRPLAEKIINCVKHDWDSYENSWEFIGSPLLTSNFHVLSLSSIYKKYNNYWQEEVLKIQLHEENINHILISTYDLQDELSPEVPLKEITLTCNPHYRYGGNKTEEQLEALLLADTMKEFISYAVGCMLGRYSLDKEGLILANEGETIEDYYQKISTTENTENTEDNHSELSVSSVYSVVNPNSFPPDEDNVIPILDGDWFTDDIADRFREFLRVTFGDQHYEENLKFIEDAIGKDIRKFFLRDFYNDHLKRYKKRPIYWLFSSPKGSFNALIYMHRYQPDTVGVVLNDYLREFRTKLEANRSNLEQISISTSASQREKTKALKEMEKLRKIIDELNEYERDVLYPLASQKIDIDLDDGVKVNYNKFGKALKKL